jgi:hypothetical protein
MQTRSLRFQRKIAELDSAPVCCAARPATKAACLSRPRLVACRGVGIVHPNARRSRKLRRQRQRCSSAGPMFWATQHALGSAAAASDSGVAARTLTRLVELEQQTPLVRPVSSKCESLAVCSRSDLRPIDLQQPCTKIQRECYAQIPQ